MAKYPKLSYDMTTSTIVHFVINQFCNSSAFSVVMWMIERVQCMYCLCIVLLYRTTEISPSACYFFVFTVHVHCIFVSPKSELAQAC